MKPLLLVAVTVPQVRRDFHVLARQYLILHQAMAFHRLLQVKVFLVQHLRVLLNLAHLLQGLVEEVRNLTRPKILNILL